MPVYFNGVKDLRTLSPIPVKKFRSILKRHPKAASVFMQKRFVELGCLLVFKIGKHSFAKRPKHEWMPLKFRMTLTR